MVRSSVLNSSPALPFTSRVSQSSSLNQNGCIVSWGNECLPPGIVGSNELIHIKCPAQSQAPNIYVIFCIIILSFWKLTSSKEACPLTLKNCSDGGPGVWEHG